MNRRWAIRSTLALAMVVPNLALALEPFKTYDNFNQPAIDQSKWPGLLDRAQEIVNKKSRLMARDYAATTSNVGSYGKSTSFYLPNPDAVTEMRATITVTNYDVVACPANSTPTLSRARVYGEFFNTGVGAPGSERGDVEAQMRVLRQSDSTDPPGVLRVQGRVTLCNDDACTTVTELGTVDFGTATLGQAVVAQVQWDKPNKRFLFSRDGGTSVPVVYTVVDSIAANAPAKSISVRNTVPNCTSASRPSGMIDALFDNILVNKSAAP